MNIKKIKHLIRFDPNEKGFYRTKNVTTYNHALWSSNCTLLLYEQSGSASGSSLYEQNYQYVRNNFDSLKQTGSRKLAETWFKRSALNKIHRIQCVSLNNVVRLTEPFFMKIDAQGAELEIIKGSDNLLKDCIGLHLECFTIPLLKNAPLLPEVKEYLENRGFLLLHQFPSHGTFNSQCDCLFINETSDEQLKRSIYSAYHSIGISRGEPSIQ